MPLPSFVIAPPPEMAPPKTRLPERLTTSYELLLISPAIEPVVPPSPICGFPPEIVVPLCAGIGAGE